MTRQDLERHQVWGYLAAIGAGFACGALAPALGLVFETVLWPVLGLLLYATFTQVPLPHLAEAVRDGRFMAAVLLGNFVAVPLLVWGLLAFLPDDPAIRLGVLLVLLVPCTDWFITFAHLGRSDTGRAIAVTPLNLLVQLALLPGYLWLFMGETFTGLLSVERAAAVFVLVIILPLAVAWATVRRAGRRPQGAALVERLGWLPVPLLALVVFLISASQVEAALGALPLLGQVLGVFLAYLVLAAVLGVLIGRLAGLEAPATRAVVFSLGSRNSFLVLPLALALPAQWQAATVVIVFQSLVELFGMVAYLWAVPRWLVPLRDGR